MNRHPTHLVVGPPRHGVVSFALGIADSLTRLAHPAPVVRLPHWTALDGSSNGIDVSGGVHLNFTDRLFGATPADAAERLSALVRRVEGTGGRVTATLHDVPQQADGGNYRQRIDAYRTVCGAVHGSATNSEHERSLLGESGMADPAGVVVVPLPLDIGDAPVSCPRIDRRSVAVLGFVYPGKGHAEVLAAMAHTPRDAEFIAIGECSAGHGDLAAGLAETADGMDRRFTLTGYLADQALPPVLHAVSVPVTHHRHVSASGSLNTWIAARRRPLTPVNRYTQEHDRRHPGTVRLYPDTPGGLAEALVSALDDPGSTWLADGVVSGSPSSQTARLYADALSRWHD